MLEKLENVLLHLVQRLKFYNQNQPRIGNQEFVIRLMDVVNWKHQWSSSAFGIERQVKMFARNSD